MRSAMTRFRWNLSDLSSGCKDAFSWGRGERKAVVLRRMCMPAGTTAGTTAAAFDSIPGPSTLPFIGVLPHAHFLPSIGVFHNVACPGLAERLRAQYGYLVRLGVSADLRQGALRPRTATARPSRRPTLFLYRPQDILQVYESEHTESPHFRRGSPLAACRRSALVPETETNRDEETFNHNINYTSVSADGGGGDHGKEEECGISRIPVLAPPRRCEAALDHITDRLVHRLIRVAGGGRGGQVPEEELEEATYTWALETAACAALDAGVGVGAAPLGLVQSARAVFTAGCLQRSEVTLRVHRQPYRDATVVFRWCQLWLQQLGLEGTTNAAALSDILLAAVDPLVHSAIRLMYYLALNPAKQQRLRDCVADADHTGEYAAACVRETLRLHTVTGGCVVRRSTATAGLQLAGYIVPSGVDLVLVHQSASRSEAEFGRASSFVPERWTCERSEPLHAAHAHAAASRPWGAACPGRQLVQRTLAALVTRMLARHHIEWHGARADVRTDTLHYMPPPYRFVLRPA